MARRTKEDALATRDQILDAAERVFQLRGVSRTSLQEIAQEAGLTRGAIYWHFENKGDIFNAMMQRVTLPMEANFKGQHGGVAPLDQIRECVRNAYHKTVHEPQVQRVFEIAIHKVEYVDELSMVRARHIEERDECVADMEQLLAQAIAKKQLGSRTSAAVAAVGLHAMIGGLLQNWLLDPKAFDLETVGAQTLEAYLAGLKAA
jgi:TetR/AcrR family acrAB operon transcriptional repressor